MIEKEKEIVNFQIPKPLLEAFDSIWPGQYNSRTDALVELVRGFVKAAKKGA